MNSPRTLAVESNIPSAAPTTLRANCLDYTSLDYTEWMCQEQEDAEVDLVRSEMSHKGGRSFDNDFDHC